MFRLWTQLSLRRRFLVGALAIGCAGAGAFAAVVFLVAHHRSHALADLPSPGTATLYEMLWDQTPVTVTITAFWRKYPITSTRDAVRHDVTLWRLMHIEDWDRLDSSIRTEGLSAMWSGYRHLVRNPRAWDRMTAADWDYVPQPMRAMAFVEMVRYWSGYYDVGRAAGLARGLVDNTLAAILMAESWFEHRSDNPLPGGARDIGLAQATDGTRASITRLYGLGLIDFAPRSEADYFDPWQATRVLVLWFRLMLAETGQDLDTAITAYHRGAPAARAGEGREYLERVLDLRRRYYYSDQPSPSWGFLRARVAALHAACAALDPSSDIWPSGAAASDALPLEHREALDVCGVREEIESAE